MDISGLVRGCLDKFKLLSVSETQHLDRVIDEFGRFRIWAGNVSAHSSGRRSLQHRLRDSAELSNAVINYLKELLEALDDVSETVSDNEADDLPLDDDFAEDDHDLFEMGDAEPHDLQTLGEIGEIISCLMRISMALRNPARNDQIRYAETALAKLFEPRDVEHVRMKFPATSDGLVQRLGKSISRHRQYFTYRKEHHEKLAHGIDEQEDEHDKKDEKQSTAATSLFHPEQQQMASFDESDAESVGTATSYAPSTTGDSALRPPSRPGIATDEIPFECMICYHIVNAPNERLWRQHVYDDMPPYVCLHEDCKAATRQFSRRRDWRQHMSEHFRYWICPYSCSVTFETSAKHQEHLRVEHSEQLNESTMMNLSESCAHESGVQSLQCPFCDQVKPTQNIWYKHVGHHLEQLALFALPKHLLSHDSDDEADEHLSESDAERVLEGLQFSDTEVEVEDDISISAEQPLSDDIHKTMSTLDELADKPSKLDQYRVLHDAYASDSDWQGRGREPQLSRIPESLHRRSNFKTPRNVSPADDKQVSDSISAHPTTINETELEKLMESSKEEDMRIVEMLLIDGVKSRSMKELNARNSKLIGSGYGDAEQGKDATSSEYVKHKDLLHGEDKSTREESQPETLLSQGPSHAQEHHKDLVEGQQVANSEYIHTMEEQLLAMQQAQDGQPGGANDRSRRMQAIQQNIQKENQVGTQSVIPEALSPELSEKEQKEMRNLLGISRRHMESIKTELADKGGLFTEDMRKHLRERLGGTDSTIRAIGEILDAQKAKQSTPQSHEHGNEGNEKPDTLGAKLICPNADCEHHVASKGFELMTELGEHIRRSHTEKHQMSRETGSEPPSQESTIDKSSVERKHVEVLLSGSSLENLEHKRAGGTLIHQKHREKAPQHVVVETSIDREEPGEATWHETVEGFGLTKPSSLSDSLIVSPLGFDESPDSSHRVSTSEGASGSQLALQQQPSSSAALVDLDREKLETEGQRAAERRHRALQDLEARPGLPEDPTALATKNFVVATETDGGSRALQALNTQQQTKETGCDSHIADGVTSKPQMTQPEDAEASAAPGTPSGLTAFEFDPGYINVAAFNEVFNHQSWSHAQATQDFNSQSHDPMTAAASDVTEEKLSSDETSIRNGLEGEEQESTGKSSIRHLGFDGNEHVHLRSPELLSDSLEANPNLTSEIQEYDPGLFGSPDGGPPDPAMNTDVLYFRHQKKRYTMHFVAGSIASGELTNMRLHTVAAQKFEVTGNLKLLFQGKTLTNKSSPCVLEGLRSGAELMIIIGKDQGVLAEDFEQLKRDQSRRERANLAEEEKEREEARPRDVEMIKTPQTTARESLGVGTWVTNTSLANSNTAPPIIKAIDDEQRRYWDPKGSSVLDIRQRRAIRSQHQATPTVNEDWTKVSDLAERRRIQSRFAERDHRKTLRQRLHALEDAAGSGSVFPGDHSEPVEISDFHGLPSDPADNTIGTPEVPEHIAQHQETKAISGFPTTTKELQDHEASADTSLGELPRSMLPDPSQDFPFPHSS